MIDFILSPINTVQVCVCMRAHFICAHLHVGLCTGAPTIWQPVEPDKEISSGLGWLHFASARSFTHALLFQGR